MIIDLKRLKAERIANGYTQEEMAIKMGWRNRTAYVKRENGNIPITANELAKISDIFGVSLNNLNIFFTKNVLEKERKGSDLNDNRTKN